MDYTDSSYFSLLLDAINTPPNFDLNEKSYEPAEVPNFSFRDNNFGSCFPSTVHLSPASTYSNLSNTPSHPNELFTCLPSPTNTVIEVKNPSPALQAHTVKSHKLEGHHQFQVMNHQTQRQQSILTTIDSKSKGKKPISKKQKRINELPYAPNMLNLQLTPLPKTPNSHGDFNCKKAPKNHSSPLPSAPLSPSSTSSSSFSHSNKSSGAYKCDYPNCDKIFTRPYNLKSHRRTHTAERPFDCPLCPKAFARQHDRNRHAKLHLGIKPYTCQFCTKSFARQDALNRHQRMDESSFPTCARSIRAKKTKKQPSFTLPSSSSSVLSPPFVSSSLSSGAMLFSSCNL